MFLLEREGQGAWVGEGKENKEGGRGGRGTTGILWKRKPYILNK